MNKLELMRQKDLPSLIAGVISATPGIDTGKLWKMASTWDSRLSVGEFESELTKSRSKYMVLNKKWYPR